MEQPSAIKHIRDIIILPFSVTVLIPFLIYRGREIEVLDNTGIKLLGALLLSSGLSLFVYTVYLFKTIGKGTLAPWTPTQKLIISGPYQYCRNPMISGVLFILLGETLLFASRTILIEAAIFFLVNTIYFMLKEEPDLYKRFGEDYKKYKKNVPRWLPRLKPYAEVK